MTFLINLEFTEILYTFELVLQWKACKEIYESSRLEVFERSSRNHFALSDTEDSTICKFGSFQNLFTMITSLFNPSTGNRMKIFTLASKHVEVRYFAVSIYSYSIEYFLGNGYKNP